MQRRCHDNPNQHIDPSPDKKLTENGFNTEATRISELVDCCSKLSQSKEHHLLFFAKSYLVVHLPDFFSVPSQLRSDLHRCGDGKKCENQSSRTRDDHAHNSEPVRKRVGVDEDTMSKTKATTCGT